ncbi:MAG: hypothetical protein WD768_00410 [Phycisphaeraceae bacterium]
MFRFILSCIILLLVAAGLSLSLDLPVALTCWLALAAGLCLFASIAIARQPPETATPAGRLGGLLIRWGFVIGRGRLSIAVILSCLVWCILGSAVIAAVAFRGQTQTMLFVLAWTIDLLALFYLVGVPLRNRSASMLRSLSPVIAVVAGMLFVSAVLWLNPQLWGGRDRALLIAGGPLLVIGGGYGLFLIVILTVGKRARWN